MLLISLYVDDIVYTGTSVTLLEEFKKEMMVAFSMTDLGVMNFFLGIEVKQNSKRIFITQSKYIEDLLCTLNMQQCKHVSTPMALNEKLQEDSSDECYDPWVFRSIIGRLLYVTHTHDLIYVSR